MQATARLDNALDLFARERDALELYLYTSCRDYHLVQDVLQEVALVVMRKRAQYDDSQPFDAWVRGIARKELAYRMRGRTYAGALLDPEALEAAVDAFAHSARASDSSKLTEHLADCIDSLGGHSRDLVRLRYELGHECAEVAKTLGRTVQGVYALLKRAKLLLKECVEKSLASEQSGKASR
jgi:RNA polymerase sigma-70 factor (ECF subfamily)